MNPIYIDYLNAFDIEALDSSNDEILRSGIAIVWRSPCQLLSFLI